MLEIDCKLGLRGITIGGRSRNYNVGQKDYNSGQGLQVSAQKLRGVTENQSSDYRDYKFIIKVT